MPCCRSLVMKHSNLTSAADTRLSMVALVRGGRGVWRTKQGTVLHFNMRRRQWQVGILINAVYECSRITRVGEGEILLTPFNQYCIAGIKSNPR